MMTGPLCEPAMNGVFKSIHNKEGAHYNTYYVDEQNGMLAIRSMFPDGEANELNFCLFSTSGVHGTYTTIEEAEAHIFAPSEDTSGCVTFLIVHPRLVCLRYGNCVPQDMEDIAFLKKLRASSWRAVQGIGVDDTPRDAEGPEG